MLFSTKRTLGPKPRNTCRALWDYTAQGARELSFMEGDTIEIVAKGSCQIKLTLFVTTLINIYHDGWWTGRLKGKEGLFPSNYIEEI